MSGTTPPLYDVHQPGLIRGTEQQAFDSHKRYFFVENPTEKWRVYLRIACFIHEEGNPDSARFLVVKRTGARDSSAAWECPKGRIEMTSQFATKGTVLDALTDGLFREVSEEAKIDTFQTLTYTGLVFQSRERDYKPNEVFQYHLFRATVSHATLQAAFETFEWFHEHPAAFKRLRKDKREKDAIQWYNPRSTRLMERWAPSLTALYLSWVMKNK